MSIFLFFPLLIEDFSTPHPWVVDPILVHWRIQARALRTPPLCRYNFFHFHAVPCQIYAKQCSGGSRISTRGHLIWKGVRQPIILQNFLPKTVWKWKNLNLEWGVCPCPSPYELSCCPTSGVCAALAPSGKYLPIQCLCSGVSKISQMGTPTPKVGGASLLFG